MNKLSAVAILKIVGELDDISWAIGRIEAKGPDHIKPYTKHIAEDVRKIKTALLDTAMVDVELQTEAAP